METANIQSVVENNIVSVALMNIQPSSYNPRKHFDEVSLAELAESIRQQGVLQPIGVRPIADTDRFEIVFGERRYRAALMAELTEISAVILHVSDETAAEMAVTENLQRKDVTPIEEANAYQKLMESGRYDVQSLAEQFGKNENYIRTRLKFVSLIPEIAELLEKDEITISVASEICRYGTDIQKEVYYKHLKDSDSMLYDCWRGLKAAEVAKFIERDFTTDLSRYAFDKTLCASCPHNTNNMMLFCEGGCGNCANRSCLAEMNASYLVEKAVQFVEQYPSVSLCYQDFNNNMIAVERLTAMGYEVEHLNTYATPYPETPVAPEKEEYDTIEEYEEAYKEYEQDFSNYMEKCKSIHERIDTGELTFYISSKYSINSLVYWVTYVHNVVYSFYRSMIYCYINSTQRCAGSIVIDIIPTNGADKRKFFPFAPYFPVTNVIKRYFYPYFPAIIGIKGYSFPYFPYLSGIMKIKTALYSLFSRLDWYKTVVFACLGGIYEGIRSLSWEIPVA